MAILRRLWPVLFLALLPLIPLYRAIFLGEAIGPFDQIRQMAPWNGPKPEVPWDVLQADGVLQFYPWRKMVLEAWAGGTAPLWNPYELGGTPLLANSQSAAFYPPHIVLGLLHVPVATAMTLLAWFHLFWAGLGVYLLARKLDASREGAAIAGGSFALSAFMLAWTGLPSVITTCAWIPWVLAAVVGLFAGDGRRLRSFLLLAFSTGMMLLAGHLQFAAYGLIAAAILAAGQAVAARKGLLAPLGATAAGLLLGFLLAAPQLLPVLEYGSFSHRRVPANETGYEAYSASALQPFELVGLVYPGLLGSPTSLTMPSEENAERVPGFWPAYIKQGENFAESAIGVGPLVALLLCCLGALRGHWRKSAGVAVIGAVGFLLAIGSVFGKFLYFYAPGWSATGSPGRAGVLFVLAACTLAGVAFTKFGEGEREFKTRAIPLGVLLGLTATSLYLLKFGMASLTIGGQPAAPLIADATRLPILNTVLTIFLVGTLAGAWLFDRRAWPALLAAVAVLPLISMPPIVRTSASSDLTVQNPPTGRIAAINGPWALLVAAPALLPPNTASLTGIHEIAGYDSLVHRDTVQMLKEIDGEDAAPPANGNMMFVKAGADPAKLAEAGVEEVWTRTELPAFGQPFAREGGVIKYRISGPGRASTPQGPARIVRETLSSLQVEATGPGRLTVRDRMMPGWSATVDGQAVPLADGRWRELDLPAGPHRVEFHYRPPGLITGLWAGIPAWLFVALASFVAWRRKPEESADSSKE